MPKSPVFPPVDVVYSFPYSPWCRYSTIYCQIGVYKGRIFAVKRVMKKFVDITRQMKEELKTLKELRYNITVCVYEEIS